MAVERLDGAAQLARGLGGRAQAIRRRCERRRFLLLQGRFIALNLAMDRVERVDASRNLSTVLQQTRRVRVQRRKFNFVDF